jgi:phosphomevalonate kinase
VIARAPGKVVLSGAYAVLEGAPAIVTAVDRYVTADTARAPDFVTPEVRAAIGDRRAPHFDASPLRAEGRKIGLGSSAAIVVASLAALHAETTGLADDQTLRDEVLPRALAAHREAQGGGSGIDVASSAWGGFIVARRLDDRLDVAALSPPPIHVEVWACADPASTAAFLERVRAFAVARPSDHRRILALLGDAASQAQRAWQSEDPRALLDALATQRDGLAALGREAGIPVATEEVAALAGLAQASGAVVMPAGAGGGDIATYFGLAPPSQSLLDALATHGLSRLGLTLGARGVHAL